MTGSRPQTQPLVVRAVSVVAGDLAGVREDLEGESSVVGVLMHETDEGPMLVEGLSPEALSTLVRTGEAEASAMLPSRDMFEKQGFSAKTAQTMKVLTTGEGPSVVYLGCGRRERLSTNELRRSCADFVRTAGRSGVAALILPIELARLAEQAVPRSRATVSGTRAVQAVAEGAALGAYRFTSHKSEAKSSSPDQLVVVGTGFEPADLEDGVKTGARIAQAVRLARDLVNEPPSSMTPTRLAEIAHELAASSPRTTAEIWESERISAERLGGLIGVARGSAEPPRLIRLDYEPSGIPGDAAGVPHVVLVGKGITFDSGGLSLKSAEGMVTMKTDMSGAAAVLATISACGDLDVRARVTAIAPVTENMPGGKATKPGDVLTIRDGQTIEVLNTDAEGRLVLADALAIAAELKPDAIVDVATLTGAAVVALGGSIGGLFSNDESLARRVESASHRAGEPLWRLPLPEQYAGHIDSDVADMKNVGKAGQAGAIAAALLLERFVGNTAWAHLDIAGPARSDEEEGVFTKGGTGFGVRTLLEMLLSFGDEPDDEGAGQQIGRDIERQL